MIEINTAKEGNTPAPVWVRPEMVTFIQHLPEKEMFWILGSPYIVAEHWDVTVKVVCNDENPDKIIKIYQRSELNKLLVAINGK